MAARQHPLADLDSGDLPVVGPDAIDANCDECTHQVATLDNQDHPKRDGVTWVAGPDGVRRYLCEAHVQDLLRYGTTPELRHADASAPTAERCQGCGTWTLRQDLADAAKKKCPDCVDPR